MNNCINEQAYVQQEHAGQATEGVAGSILGGDTRGIGATIRATVDVRANYGFPVALTRALSGNRITRAGWNGPGQWVSMNRGTPGINAPYLQMMNTKGLLVPWVPSQGDLFATDWAILP